MCSTGVDTAPNDSRLRITNNLTSLPEGGLKIVKKSYSNYKQQD